MKCRNCGKKVKTPFLDLGSSPPSNAYLTAESIDMPDKWYPLKVLVCDHCWLVQTDDKTTCEELFTSDYAYFSSFSTTWLAHAERYVTEMTERFSLDSSSFVVEVAANDGYLLQFFRERSIPCLGIEPTTSTARAAREKGIAIREEFFGFDLAHTMRSEGLRADLMVANNVLAHVPDINDFVSGFTELLKPEGVATFEFPHLYQLVRKNQFDTIYHEHYSYLSLTAVSDVMWKNDLRIFDVEELPTHGGSLRIFISHKNSKRYMPTGRVKELLCREESAGLKTTEYYTGFQKQANKVKNEFLSFLIGCNREGKRVIGYGAAAKGNTLLNYAGIRGDLLPYVVDLSPSKIGRYLPGSRVPIVDEMIIREDCPDYVVIFPWNLKEEIINQLSYIRDWGGKFVIAVPSLEVI